MGAGAAMGQSVNTEHLPNPRRGHPDNAVAAGTGSACDKVRVFLAGLASQGVLTTQANPVGFLTYFGNSQNRV